VPHHPPPSVQGQARALRGTPPPADHAPVDSEGLGTAMPPQPSLEGRTILQVIPSLETGGAERTTIDIAAAVVAAGGRAMVVSEGGRMAQELASVGAEHREMPVARKAPQALVRNAGRLRALLAAEAVDLVHARSRAPAWSSFLAARRAGCPFVTTYHGAYGESGRLKRFYNSVMARGDAVIANSAYTADLIAKRHPFAKGRIVVIPRGSDLSAFDAPDVPARAARMREAWGVAADAPVVLHLARLTRWKGQTVTVAAMAALAERGCEAAVAVLAGDDQGRSDYRAEVLAAAEQAGLAGRVFLIGHVADVPAAIAASDVVVVPSIEPEAFGRAAVEAQAGGRPVVVSDIGAVRETVLAPPAVAEAARTGWHVPAGDAEALAGTLATVLDADPGLRAAVGARGKAHASANFSLAAMQHRTLAVYRALLARPII